MVGNWEFPLDPWVPWESYGNRTCEAKLTGIEMGMGIKS